MMQLSHALIGRGLRQCKFVDAVGTWGVPSLAFLAVIAVPQSNASVIDSFHTSSGREGFDLEFSIVERHKCPLLPKIIVTGGNINSVVLALSELKPIVAFAIARKTTVTMHHAKLFVFVGFLLSHVALFPIKLNAKRIAHAQDRGYHLRNILEEHFFAAVLSCLGCCLLLWDAKILFPCPFQLAVYITIWLVGGDGRLRG
jgi:hypothetical protein